MYYQRKFMIKQCSNEDIPIIEAIINEAASVYKGVIPADRWHEPYMSRNELVSEIESGVVFWGYYEAGQLLGVMGLQKVKDATLIRHAYVRKFQQGKGIGAKLIRHLTSMTTGQFLVGTWAAAEWAIRFYAANGFEQVSESEKNLLLNTYWKIPARQVETSVVLRHEA